MLKRHVSIVATLIVLLSSRTCPADFQVTDSVTSINGVAVTGNPFTDQYGNVLRFTSYSATGFNFAPSAGFSMSTPSPNPNFLGGDDVLISTITITNLVSGSSLTLMQRQGFFFSRNGPNTLAVSLDNNATLSVNGSSFIARVFLLDGLSVGVGGVRSYAGSGDAGAVGEFGTSVLITPEPSSFILCGIAGVVGLAVTRVRRGHVVK